MCPNKLRSDLFSSSCVPIYNLVSVREQDTEPLHGRSLEDTLENACQFNEENPSF